MLAFDLTDISRPTMRIQMTPAVLEILEQDFDDEEDTIIDATLSDGIPLPVCPFDDTELHLAEAFA
jgi:hypothetical protein